MFCLRVPIITPRLILRPLEENDGLAISKATSETWGDLSKWMRWAVDRGKLSDPIGCAAYAKKCQESFLEQSDFTFGGFSKEDNELVLISRLAFLNPKKNFFELCGYWCRKSYQGKGFMTEGVNAIVRYTFQEFNAEKIQIKHAAGNTRTRAVMDRLGFVEESVIKQGHFLPNGSVVDEHVLFLYNQKNLPPIEVTW